MWLFSFKTCAEVQAFVYAHNTEYLMQTNISGVMHIIFHIYTTQKISAHEKKTFICKQTLRSMRDIKSNSSDWLKQFKQYKWCYVQLPVCMFLYALRSGRRVKRKDNLVMPSRIGILRRQNNELKLTPEVGSWGPDAW